MTPHWEDGCSHLIIDTYIGSFSLNEFKYDVYTYEKLNKTNVCIRYGNRDSDYLSPGTVEQLQLLVRRYPNVLIYSTALSMILNKK